ncbi:MmcQ/YjbR family DNA-binding protein [Streptomyces sp. R28]|uniref:MmcQ/YjbR family DNA-binding protein n=1 Tax=Streptomyces sp. R28 TaxID=3238628 RepID=A0AB39Q7L7_9ACTN
MAVPGNALKKWEKAREFALGVPGVAGPRGGAAYRYSPWGETVAKVNKKVFVFLDVDDGSHPLGITVKLKDEAAHAHALTCAQQGAPRAELPCDWAEESCRTIAPKRLISRAGRVLIPPAAVRRRASGG